MLRGLEARHLQGAALGGVGVFAGPVQLAAGVALEVREAERLLVPRDLDASLAGVPDGQQLPVFLGHGRQASMSGEAETGGMAGGDSIRLGMTAEWQGRRVP